MSRRLWFLSLPVLALAAAGGLTWTLTAREHAPGDPADAEQVAVGQALYSWNCARCHGEDLGGELGWAKDETGLSQEEIDEIAGRLGDVAPAHDQSGSTWRRDDKVLYKIIHEGPEKALDKPSSRMPAFQDRLSDEEIWSIIAFMKDNWAQARELAGGG